MKKIAVLRETAPGERRVALVPDSVAALRKKEFSVFVESGAGAEAGWDDDAYRAAGAEVVDSAAGALGAADVVAVVRGAELADGAAAEALRAGQIVVGMLDPLGRPEASRRLAERGLTVFALELLPRVTRAQSMDVLSSMATVAGYKAVLEAAVRLPRMFPMMITAAGTVSPARVFVIGAGVAGLQAIATARRLGAQVKAYDVRPAVEEQVRSVGGVFVSLPLETGEAEDKGGYARRMDESFYRRQRELLSGVLRDSDVVVTTAVVPGAPAPLLITREMLEAMPAGAVVIDLAAERGGNCEATQPDREVVVERVKVFGPTNLPATVPYHASQMYSRNIAAFLTHVLAGEALNVEDEIGGETLVARDGAVRHPRVLEKLGAQSGAGTQAEG